MRLRINKPLIDDVLTLLKDGTKYSALSFLIFAFYLAALKIVAMQQGYYPPRTDGTLLVEPEWLMLAPVQGFFAVFLLVYLAVVLKVRLDRRVVSTAIIGAGFYGLYLVVLLAVLRHFDLTYLLPNNIGIILSLEGSSYVTSMVHGLATGFIVAIVCMLNKRPTISPHEGLRLAFCIWFMALISLFIYFVTHNLL